MSSKRCFDDYQIQQFQCSDEEEDNDEDNDDVDNDLFLSRQLSTDLLITQTQTKKIKIFYTPGMF